MTLTIPTAPAEMPVFTYTSFSGSSNPDDHGIDPETQWWAEVAHRTRRGDARATVYAPGWQEIVHYTAATDRLTSEDDLLEIGRDAVLIARAASQYLEGGDASSVDREAWQAIPESFRHVPRAWRRANYSRFADYEQEIKKARDMETGDFPQEFTVMPLNI